MATDRKVNFQIFTELTKDGGLCRAKVQAHSFFKNCLNGSVVNKAGGLHWVNQPVTPSCEGCPALKKIRDEAARQDMD